MVQTLMQAAISMEDFGDLQADFPLTFRLRRSWSESDVMELYKASEYNCESALLDGADPSKCTQDDVSTADGSDESEGSTNGDWAEQMEAEVGPPGQWATLSSCVENTPWSGFVDALAGPPGQLVTPPGQLGHGMPQALPGNFSSQANPLDRADLVESPALCNGAAQIPPGSEEPTTILVSNLPRVCNRSMLVEILTAEGLLLDCDLVYLPVEFKVGIGYGYGFVNFTTHQAACAALEVLDGLTNSGKESLTEGALEARWSVKQGLLTHIDMYRNSPVMHKSVDDEAKPALLMRGMRMPFPEPTCRLRAPRQRRRILTQPEDEADATQ